jgi:hypothetical protein
MIPSDFADEMMNPAGEWKGLFRGKIKRYTTHF